MGGTNLNKNLQESKANSRTEIIFNKEHLKELTNSKLKCLGVFFSIDHSYHYGKNLSLLFDALIHALSNHGTNIAEVGLILGSPQHLQLTFIARYGVSEEIALEQAKLYFCHWIYHQLK